MADTITIGPNTIQIIPNAAGISNFDITTYFPNGIRCTDVVFVGAAATDILKVRQKLATGNFLVPKLVGLVSIETFGEPQDCFPYILATDCTLSAPASSIIIFHYI